MRAPKGIWPRWNQRWGKMDGTSEYFWNLGHSFGHNSMRLKRIWEGDISFENPKSPLKIGYLILIKFKLKNLNVFDCKNRTFLRKITYFKNFSLNFQKK
jgi:hypothetical protein